MQPSTTTPPAQGPVRFWGPVILGVLGVLALPFLALLWPPLLILLLAPWLIACCNTSNPRKN